MSAEPTVFLSAGEASGDQHGARLAAELRRRIPGIRLVGLGGSRMEAEGVELLADLDRLAVLGFAEVVRHLPDLLRLRREVRRFLLEAQVDLLVPIDYPGFNLPLAGWAHRRGIPVVYYIAPQVWAWRESRAARLARVADRVCVVLPFEEELLRRWGARAEFVGHPLLDGEADRAPEARGAGGRPVGGTERGGAEAPTVLGLFPGSRPQEVERMLPDFLGAWERLRTDHAGLRVRVARAADLPADLFADCPPEAVVTPELAAREATAALTKSGTITLQLAIAGVPMVVAYRMHPITYRIARRLVRVPHIALVNLVADRRIVPERIQNEVEPGALAEAVDPLLRRGSEPRRRMRRALDGVRERLGGPGCAARVAEVCREVLEA